jgi:DNA modification methylase
MIQWGKGATVRWRCPSCHRVRRKEYHRKTEVAPGAPLDAVEPHVFLQDADLTLYNGDCLDVLRGLPDESVHVCATSPPFFGLRDYGVEGQIGLEETPEEWAERLVEVFREMRRVLRTDGTFWLEVGDAYAANRSYQVTDSKYHDVGNNMPARVPPGYKSKDLIGAPWLLAFALRADGWWLRSEVIWDKPNAMPESVQDRPTRSHSTVFLLTKSARYFYDIDAIREPHQHDGRKITTVKQGENSIQHRDGERWPGEGANARSVWRVATASSQHKHFATWPEKLISKMILAGCPERVCEVCGEPSQRIVERDRENVEGWAPVRKLDYSQNAAEQGNGRFGDPVFQTLGWTDCGHNAWKPGVVLDPFGGSGTTGLVARHHGRRSILIELNESYCQLIAERTRQLSLLA